MHHYCIITNILTCLGKRSCIWRYIICSFKAVESAVISSGKNTSAPTSKSTGNIFSAVKSNYKLTASRILTSPIIYFVSISVFAFCAHLKIVCDYAISAGSVLPAGEAQWLEPCQIVPCLSRVRLNWTSPDGGSWRATSHMKVDDCCIIICA